MLLTCRIAELNNPFVTKFTYSGDLVYLEHVVVLMTVGVSNGRRGDLRVELSPLLRNSHTLECVTSCGPPNIVRNGYCCDPTQDKPTCQTSGNEKKLLNHGWFTTYICYRA